MAEDPVALCRRAYELYGKADFEGLLELFGEDVEVYVAPPNFESGTYHGRAAYRGLIERWGTAWSQMRIEPREMTTAGDWVFALVDYVGCTRDGLEVRQPSWELSLWRDGQVRRYDVYFDAAQGPRAFAERAAEVAAAS
jgi:ketosteroid isomerase-like protein